MFRSPVCRSIGCLSIAAASFSAQVSELSPKVQTGTSQARNVSTFRSASRLVNVYVIVTDRDGHSVQGLHKDDFQLFDNGHQEKIAFFSTGDTDNSSGSNEVRAFPPGVYTNDPHASAVPDEDVNIILFDTINTAYLSQAYSLGKIRILLRQLRPEDRVGIYVLNENGLKIVYEPTEPASTLLKAMQRYDETHRRPPDSKAAAAAETSTGLLELDRFLRGKDDHRPMSRCDEGRLPLTIAAFQEIARSTAGLRGRKAIIWVTEHIPLPYYEDDDQNAIDLAANTRFCGLQYLGPDLLAEEPANFRAASASGVSRSFEPANSAGEPETGRRTGLGPIRDRELTENDQLDLLLRMLTQNNIALYPVSSEGLQTVQLFGPHGVDTAAHAKLDPWTGGMGMTQKVLDNVHAVANVESHQAMDRLARLTGGRPYYDRNDLETGIRRALDDAKYGYELAYYPDHDRWNGDWRKIQLKVNRPGATVLARSGYYAFPEPKLLPPKASKQLLAEIAASPLEDTEIPITVKMTPLSNTGATAIDARVYLRAENLFTTQLGGGWKSNFEVLLFQLNARNEILDVTTQNVSAELTDAKYSEALRLGMDTVERVQMKPGAALLYVLVHDKKSDSVGSVRIPLHDYAAN